MTQVVLVPGIFGTAMRDAAGEVIWPPGEMRRVLSNDELVSLLLRDDTTALDPITHAGLVSGFYGPVERAIASLPGCTLVPVGYDWRKDVATGAAALAARLAALPGDDDIVIVAHSMGGLVARWLLEATAPDGAAWRRRLRTLVCAATPHLGAPACLFEVDGAIGVDNFFLPGWATRLLAAHPATFAAGYQLLPSPNVACVRGSTLGGVQSIAACAQQIVPPLVPAGLDALSALHAALDRFRKPAGITYFQAYGHGIATTIAGVALTPGGRAAESGGDGDGTVPVWSAHPGPPDVTVPPGTFTEIAAFTATHVGILADGGFQATLARWITAPRAAG